VTLEFNKIVPQIQQMGTDLHGADQAASRKLSAAWEAFQLLADADRIWQQVAIARERDAGYRGIAPFNPAGSPNESIVKTYPLPYCTDRATVLAVDGSQVYPDPHAAVLYYLTNIAVFVYHHGVDGALPEPISVPQLYFSDEDLHEKGGDGGRVIANAAVNARRSVFEIQLLAQETYRRAQSNHARPLLALADGPLLFWLGGDVPNTRSLMADYYEAFDLLGQADALLTGYVDQPRSRFLISTLYLMTLSEAEIDRAALVTAGLFEGLEDRILMQNLLAPGDRSALMVQQSPQNKAYREYLAEFEIVFFYVNVAAPGQAPYLARVEIPRWVAASSRAIDAVHALLYSQCQLTDRYPYALTRADECAVVHSHEKQALDQMIHVELLNRDIGFAQSQKLSMKDVARPGRQSRRPSTTLRVDRS